MKALCRDAKDAGVACRFATVCHEPRQALMHRLNLRGMDCWAYVRLAEREAYEPPTEREAIEQEGAG